MLCQTFFGSLKIWVQKLEFNKIYGQKNFRLEKMFAPKRIMSKKIESEKNKYPQKLFVKKDLGGKGQMFPG